MALMSGMWGGQSGSFTVFHVSEVDLVDKIFEEEC